MIPLLPGKRLHLRPLLLRRVDKTSSVALLVITPIQVELLVCRQEVEEAGRVVVTPFTPFGVNGVTILHGKLLKGKSGRPGSNRRRPAWEIGVQLKTKNNGAYGLHFESMNSTESSLSCLEPSLNDVEMM